MFAKKQDAIIYYEDQLDKVDKQIAGKELFYLSFSFLFFSFLSLFLYLFHLLFLTVIIRY